MGARDILGKKMFNVPFNRDAILRIISVVASDLGMFFKILAKTIYHLVPTATLTVLLFQVLGDTYLPVTEPQKQAVSITDDQSYAFYDLPLPEWLHGFTLPVHEIPVPENPNLLPGAPRIYRNGVHQGIDFYCPFATPVRSAKEGYILRIDQSYQEIPVTFRNYLLETPRILYQTPPEILEVLHGQCVILDHGITDGRWVISVYSHLSGVNEDLKLGMFVEQGAIIGYAGVSGTSTAYEDFFTKQTKCHLHFEIRANGKPLGLGMTSQEAGMLYNAVFSQDEQRTEE